MMLIHQMTHATKNGCKIFHRLIARVQYDDDDDFLLVIMYEFLVSVYIAYTASASFTA